MNHDATAAADDAMAMVAMAAVVAAVHRFLDGVCLDEGLRLRVYVAGELAHEARVTADDPGTIGDQVLAVAARQGRVREAADAAGLPWLAEMHAPASGEYFRFGTDHAGMVAPAPAGGG